MKVMLLVLSFYMCLLGYYHYQLTMAEERRVVAERALIVEMTRKPLKCRREEYRWISNRSGSTSL